MGWFIQDLSVLIVAAAILSYVAVLSKQPVIIAYIIGGVLFGPWGLRWITELGFITAVSHIGVTLLLFLAGLCLHPEHLRRLFRPSFMVTLGSCFSLFIVAFLFAVDWGFGWVDSFYIGSALMFSSTIIAVKLLPTTKLHHGQIGAISIGVLIAQDFIAVVILVFMRGVVMGQPAVFALAQLFVKLIILVLFSFVFEQFVLRRVLAKVERFHETIFIIGLAWCLGLAAIFDKMGLSYEIGAFFAGVALARHPISLFISENLKPLRDFFLIVFFFALGAKINLGIIKDIVLPALILGVIFVIIKPILVTVFFRWAGQDPALSREAGVRLGQGSEFALLIALLAFDLGHINQQTSQLIQVTTIFTMLISSYIVVFSYPTPIGTVKGLIQD